MNPSIPHPLPLAASRTNVRATEKGTNVRVPLAFRLLGQMAGLLHPAIAARLLVLLFTLPRRRARPAREQRALRHAEPFGLRLPSGVRVQAWSWGAGPVVVLAHGWEGRGSQLATFTGPLLARGYRVITFDAPAHGDSGGRFTDVRDFAAALRAVEAREGRVHAVVAHSMGALGFALAQRQGLRVDRAVLVAPVLSPARPFTALASALGLRGPRLDEVKAEIAGYAQTSWPQLVDGGLYDSVDATTLVLHDVDDAIAKPEEATTIAARVGARRRVTRGLGHNRVLRDEGVVDAAVRFVDEGRPGRERPRDGWDRFLDELDVSLSLQAWA